VVVNIGTFTISFFGNNQYRYVRTINTNHANYFILACANVIPRTPVAVRPIGRTLDSLKRIALPERKASTISLVPLVKQASINWSPSLIFIALIPFARGLE